MRGRRPKPVETRRREGNMGKRALPDALLLGGELVRPRGLPPEAARLWDDVVPLLVKQGLAGAADRPALTALCVQWARAERARAVIRSEGMFAQGSMGQLREHPALAVERAAVSLFLKLAAETGLTAVARARIAAANGSTPPLGGELAKVIDLRPELRTVGE